MEMKTILKLCISPTLEPQGGIYSQLGKREARGQALAQNAAPTVRLRKRGPGRVSAAILAPRARRFEPRAVQSVLCQVLCPVLSFPPLICTESAI